LPKKKGGIKETFKKKLDWQVKNCPHGIALREISAMPAVKPPKLRFHPKEPHRNLGRSRPTGLATVKGIIDKGSIVIS